MESHHASFKKHFLRIGLSHPELENKVKEVLGRSPHYPLHLTITTIHLADQDGLFSTVTGALSDWEPPLPDTLDLENKRLEVMGKSHVKFLSICFSCKNLDLSFLIENLCGHLCKKLSLMCHTIEVNGRLEYELVDSLRIPLMRIPFGEKMTHISLLSSNDLKKGGKMDYDKYRKDNSFLLTLINPSIINNCPFRIHSKALS